MACACTDMPLLKLRLGLALESSLILVVLLVGLESSGMAHLMTGFLQEIMLEMTLLSLPSSFHEICLSVAPSISLMLVSKDL